MVRIALLQDHQIEPSDILTDMKERRGGQLRPIDRILLNSPAVARGWNSHVDAMRRLTEIPVLLRELATLVTCYAMKHQYETDIHGPLFLKAGGTAEQLADLADLDKADFNRSLFDRQQLAVMALAIEMTNEIDVRGETFAELAAVMPDDRAILEIVAIVATYNMTNRVQRALNLNI